MASDQQISVGVIVSRETVDHPWEDIHWRPVGVFLDPPPKADWREIGRGRGHVHYHAATVTLALNRKCAMNYRVNLANGIPSVYVVVRQRPGASADVPIEICRVSVSPFEIDANGHNISEHVERVPMPPALIELVQRFIEQAGAAEQPRSGRSRREARDDKFSGFGLDLGGFGGHLSTGK